MPIKLPANHPEFSNLKAEGVPLMSEDTALRQDIRPLRIGLLNLMPTKIQTEVQFASLIGAGPLQIEIRFIRMSNHESKHTSREHMMRFYRPFSEIRDQKFDGLIITGAPIEHLAFEDVTYWDEMIEVMNWTQSNVHSTFGVCWGAMAMLYYFHRVPKHILTEKLSGCFRQMNLVPSSPYLRGFSDNCIVPVSRWTQVLASDLDANNLPILLGSDITGPGLIEDPAHRALYIMNHFEYDSHTLAGEYSRDKGKDDQKTTLPVNYFPDDDPNRPPENRWRSHGYLLYGNWINEIYQSVPYQLSRIGE
ncbi:MAG: homoserine O-succinyltransferase [Aestuariivita sp.]|nr:homoserine O-succinyltransferase [Aestuariivita sp.]MCY4201784.1 homoserine O-succinyltransferase [Aestuariivita sp.]